MCLARSLDDVDYLLELTISSMKSSDSETLKFTCPQNILKVFYFRVLFSSEFTNIFISQIVPNSNSISYSERKQTNYIFGIGA